MESLRELYKIGRGPSSSHTMGPERACREFAQAYPDADRYKAVLFGSLAKTGRGHRTDWVIEQTLLPKAVEIVFDERNLPLLHPNTMELYAYRGEEQVGFWRVYSVGGGKITIEGIPSADPPSVYALHSYADIAAYCRERELRLWEYVRKVEGEEIFDYLGQIWEQMKQSIHCGLRASGVLAGGLGVVRRAKILYDGRHIDESAETRENRLVCAYAFAVGEENAAGGTIVTAPTCGASGVLPAVLNYQQKRRSFSDEQIVQALAAGGVVGNLIKTNASISGAECGCQAEIGSACAMASAAMAELFGMRLEQIEYAAEVAMEHHLGLTCDPIHGLVQIPCIERNAVAAMRAINAVNLANFLTDSRKISLDLVIQTMYETGRDLNHGYRETSEGGLAKLYN